MSEGHVIKACIDWLCLHQCDIIRNNTGAYKAESGHYIRYGKKGSGDILALSPFGRWVEVEAKTRDGQLRPEQLERMALVRSKGGVYVVARGNIDALEQYKSEILAKPLWQAV